MTRNMAKPAPVLLAARALARHLSEATIPRQAADVADLLVTERIIRALEEAGWRPPATRGR